MSRPADRDELLARIDSDYQQLLTEVARVEPIARLEPGACDAWSVKDILAHLDAWHGLFMAWESVGAGGEIPELPSRGYTWKETPALNAAIWERTRDVPYEDVVASLAASHARIRDAVAGYDEASLFQKRRYAWTGSTSVGSYAVSATTSHYAWAARLVRRFANRKPPG